MSEHKEPIPSMIYNASVGGHVTNSQQIIDENENKEQSQINAEVKQNLGQGGSVDTRINQAKNDIIGEASSNGNTLKKIEDRVSPLESAICSGGSIDSRIKEAVNVEKTRAEEKESILDNKITTEKTRAEEAEGNLNKKIDTLNTIVGSGDSINSRISDAVAKETTRAQNVESTLQTNIDTETTRAQTAEEQLKTLYNNLQQSQPIPVTELPDIGEEGKIYRLAGTINYSDYMWNGIQFIKMATYNNAIDNKPIVESENLVKSGGVFTAIEAEKNRAEAAEEANAQGIIYDVSAHNNGAVFESLSALLISSDLDTLIPTSAQHGGMSIRFIQGSKQSSDNKYVQYRLMSNTFNTTPANWQGVDDEPTAGSENLVKSSGVYGLFEETIGFSGDLSFDANLYCGYYYSASDHKIMPAVASMNGVLIKLKQGSTYTIKTGYYGYLFSSIPVIDSNDGYIDSVPVGNTFVAAENYNYLLVDVQPAVASIVIINCNIPGLITEINNIAEEVFGLNLDQTMPKIKPGTRLSQFFACGGHVSVKLSLSEGTTDTLWRIISSQDGTTYKENLLNNLILGNTYEVDIPNDCIGIFVFTYSTTATGAPTGDIYRVEIQGESLDSKISEIEDTLDEQLPELSENAVPLKGETIVCFGDSLTEFKYLDKSWTDNFADISKANVINVGVGGSQIRRRKEVTLPIQPSASADEGFAALDMVNMVTAATSGNYSLVDAGAAHLDAIYSYTRFSDIVNRLKSVDWTKVSKVIVMGGTNDWNNNNGNTENKNNPFDIDYTLGALNTIIKNLLEAYPNVRVYYASPNVCYRVPNNFSAEIDYKVGDYVEKYNGSLSLYEYFRFTNNHPHGAWNDNDVQYIGNESDKRSIRVPELFSDNWKNNGKTLKEFSELLCFTAQSNHIAVHDSYNTLGWNEYNFDSIFNNNDSSHPYKGFKELGNRLYRFVVSPVKQASSTVNNYVRTIEQDFTSSEKTQVRNNIEAASAESVKNINSDLYGNLTTITYPKITPGTRLKENVDCSNGIYHIKLELIEGETTTLYSIYARISDNPQAKVLKHNCALGQNYDIEITNDENTYVGFQIMTQTNSATGSSVGDIYKLSYVSQDDLGLNYDVEKLKEDSSALRLEVDNIKDSYAQFVFTNKAIANRFIKEVFIDKAKVLKQEPNWGNDFYIHGVWKNHNNQYYRVYIRNTPTNIADTTKIIMVEVNYQSSLAYVYNNTYGVYLIVNWDVVNDGGSDTDGAKFADICYSLDYSPSIKTALNPSGEPTIVSMNRNTNTNFANLLKTVGETAMASWVDDDGVFDGDSGQGTGGNIQTVIKPVADVVGIPVTFGIICDENRPLSAQINLVGGGTATKVEYMMSLQKLGHHFTAHPYHNGWYGDHYDITVVEPLLISCLVELQKANMLHSDLLIYPGSSSSNPLIVDIIRKWCVCGVIAGYGTPNHLGDSTKWQLKRTFINFENYYDLHHNDQGFVSALQWYKDQVDVAAENGDWIIFGTHSYQFTPSDDTSNPNANTKGNLVLLMQYALSKGLEYRTLWDAYNRRKYLFDFKEINI